MEEATHNAIKPLRADLSKACFDFARELPTLIRHWPKVDRMGFGRKLEEHVYKLLESAIVITNPTIENDDKRRHVSNMSSACDMVLVYLRLAYAQKSLSPERYARLSEQAVVIGKQVGGLHRYFSTRVPQ